jgi:hypothetical protein
MDVIPRFFVLGVAARLINSDLKIPGAVYELLSIYLLLAIGLKGGVELARQDVLTLLPAVGLVLLMGLLLPLLAFPILRWRFVRADAASIAAHYGSVSVVTYAVCATALTTRQLDYEAYFPVFVAILEVPAIIIGVLLARLGANGTGTPTKWGLLAHEIFSGKSVVLLIGGIAIGWTGGPTSIEPLVPLFYTLFKGALCLFLLEMGLVAANRLGDLRRAGAFLVAFGILFPLVGAAVGLACGWLLDFTPGGVALLMTLGASASYIAAPAAMRIAVPEANPTLSIGAALGITFPFNIIAGIPLYIAVAERLRS